MRNEKELDAFISDTLEVSDLVDEMNWEDNTEFLSLEDAGLEESSDWDCFDCVGASQYNFDYWDGESSEVSE